MWHEYMFNICGHYVAYAVYALTISVDQSIIKSIWNHIYFNVSLLPFIHNYFQTMLQILWQSHPRPDHNFRNIAWSGWLKLNQTNILLVVPDQCLVPSTPWNRIIIPFHVGSSLLVVWPLCSQTQTHGSIWIIHTRTCIYIYIWIYMNISY